MQISTHFADIVREYRKSMQWTQGEAAEKWGYSVDTISAWERRKRKPSNQEIPRLARYLGMQDEELAECIKHEGNKTPMHSNAMLENAFATWGELQHIYRNRSEFNREFSYNKIFENARHVLAVGIGLNAIAQNYSKADIIDSITERECQYQLCFLEPDCQSCLRRENEEGYEEGFISDLTRLNIKNMFNVVRQLRKKDDPFKGLLEIRTYDFSPRFNIYIVDDSLMTVQWYAYGRGSDTPTFVLRRQNNKGLFEYYAEAAKYILDRSNLVNSTTIVERDKDSETAK